MNPPPQNSDLQNARMPEESAFDFVRVDVEVGDQNKSASQCLTQWSETSPETHPIFILLY
jgi:hypothetical protein